LTGYATSTREARFEALGRVATQWQLGGGNQGYLDKPRDASGRMKPISCVPI
jgi:hypothetical protein